MAEIKKIKIEKNKTEDEFDIREIYTPLSVAKKEIWRRWNDPVLRKKVEDFLCGDIPDFLENHPRAYLARHIASPNLELFRFIELSKLAELDPVCPEYSEDRLFAANLDKYHLCKLFFHDGNGKNMGDKISTIKIIDFENSEGKSFNRLKTLWGENFIDFHHRILRHLIPTADNMIEDVSIWIKRKGGKPQNFYRYFFALFICHGVLFENFLSKDGELYFTKEIVMPTFKEVEKIFGVRPLIVPIEPLDDESFLYWRCYSASIKSLIQER